MGSLLESLTYGDYNQIHKLVLASYILFGIFILKLLIGQTNKFIRNDRNILITYILFIIIFVGMRGRHVGTDTYNYYYIYFIPVTIKANNIFETFFIIDTDFLFKVLLSFSNLHQSFTLFLLSVSIVLNVVLYIFVRKFTDYGKRGSSLILFLTFASSFSFLNLETNILRNALSISFILLALYYLLEKKYKYWIIFMIVAYLFHRTAIIYFCIMSIILLFKNIPIKYYLIFYVIAIGLSFVGFGFHAIPFLTNFGNEDLKSLSFAGETTYNIGFRFDFVLYNSFFLFLFLKFSNWNNLRDLILIKFYILSSVIFFFNFYIPFSDRFGLYSWVIIPLLLFNTINESFPEKKVFISNIVVISYFIINNIILFP